MFKEKTSIVAARFSPLKVLNPSTLSDRQAEMTRSVSDNQLSSQFSSTEEIIEEARAGRMFLLIDDESRENEGDLVIPAQFANHAAINFMARYGRGLICLALTRERTEWLGLTPMSPTNGSRHATAFTVSIEAREGITTGISAQDRAHTIAVAIAPKSTSYDLVSPGHVFPLAARDGGTLVRAGHTEAAVDVARLAGLDPSGVICEVMKDDGTMARLPDLLEFARLHNMKIGTIADLITHRRRRERLVECVSSDQVTDGMGRNWKISIFRDQINGKEHLALTKGDLTTPEPVLVRMQVENAIDHMLSTHRAVALSKSLEVIEAAGRGAIIMIRGNKLTMPANPSPIAPEEMPLFKSYGIGAQILVELGVSELELLAASKPMAIVALEGYGLHVTGWQRVG